MISHRSRNGIVVLALLGAFSFWLGRLQDGEPARPTRGLDTQLNYALQDFKARFYDERGRPSVYLAAPRFESDATSGIGTVQQPLLEIHEQGFVWNIIADSAVVSEDQELIFLPGDVNLRRNGRSPGDWLVIDTENVTVEVSPRIARSEQAVSVADATGVLNATGFRVNMLQNRYQLTSDVTGRFRVQ